MGLAKSGEYNIKEGYMLCNILRRLYAMQHIESKRPTSRAFALCWNNVVLPKVRCFDWLALRERILRVIN